MITVKNVHGCNIIAIENFLSEDEIASFWDLFHKIDNDTWADPKNTGSAYYSNETDDCVYLKRNLGIFLSEIEYLQQHVFSDKIANKFFNCIKDLCSENYFTRDSVYFAACNTNWDNHLISLYSDSDYYESHRDSSVITMILYMYKEPKNFTGGELYFPELDTEFNCVNNSAIIFPSTLMHEVKTVQTQCEISNEMKRISYTIFCGHNLNNDKIS